MDAILRNWGRWVRDREIQGHCASIEHRYRPRWRPDSAPTGWGDWLTTPVHGLLPSVDPLLALAVERTMRHVPTDHRRALKLHYVLRMPWRLSCKRLHLAYDCWEQFLCDAQYMVANLLKQSTQKPLTNIHFGRISVSTIRIPVQTETLEPVGSEGNG